ncbi:MAG TPA: PAS domain S-box protein [Acidimicrobiales bacterium]|nr:PAS domain S-box protein [Acidimicrobiales bacterium]
MSNVEAVPVWSAEAWRLAFSNAPIGCAIVALNGRILQVNEALCRIVGYGASELVSLTFQDITHPDDLDADLALVKALVAGDVPKYQMEKRYLRPDGTQVWSNLTVSLMHNSDGSPAYFISQIEDIHERRDADEALRLSEERLRSLTDSIQEAIIGADLHGTITTWNRSAAKMFGYTRDEAVGQKVTLIIRPSERPAHTAGLARLAAGGKPRIIGQPVRFVALRVDGSEIPVEIRITTSETAGLRQYTAVVKDLSERDSYEEKAAILSALLDTDEAAVIAFTLDGTVTTWSRGAEHLYGYTAAEACGKRVGLLLMDPEPDLPSKFEEIMRRVTEGKSAAYDGRRRTKDGSTIGVSVTLKPLLERGEVIGIVGITRPLASTSAS